MGDRRMVSTVVAAGTVIRVEEPQGSVIWGDLQRHPEGSRICFIDDTVLFPYREYRKELFFFSCCFHFVFV